METSFLVIFTFLLLQRFGASSESMMTNSSIVTCIERERKSLLIFKERLTDMYRTRLSTWTGVECCEWVGVHCDKRSGHVIRLDLRTPAFFSTDKMKWYYDNPLGGEVSPSLLNLKHLRYLDLSMNYFSGHIPKFLGSFKHLEYLNLSCSGFSGVVPHHLGNLSRLQYLDLNSLYHVRPDAISGCSSMNIDDLQWVPSLSSLKFLGLSGSYIAMNLTDELDWFSEVNMLPSLLTLNLASCDINFPSITSVNFTSLNSLDLSFNSINSTIPVWLSNLTELTHLDLSGNKFHGQIPDFLGTLSSLTLLDLSSNEFHGLVPTDVKNLYQLSVLDLSWNRIVGDLPSLIGSMSEFLAKSLVYLSLAGNEFSGCIPNTIGDFKKLENLRLNRNALSGHVPPSLGGLTSLKELDVSYNSLEGNLSEVHFIKLKNLTLLDLSSTYLALNVSSRWNPPFQLREFYASSCNIGPQFPSWLQTQTNLEHLYLSNSSIRDTLPDWFENIATHIVDLDLSYNQIGGELPALPSNVHVLDLSDNLLSGNFPKTNGTVNQNLHYIDLSKNQLTGAVPKHLCNILDIWLLDLSQNNFSGRLPRCLWNLDLSVIDLTNNTITGFLPSSLGILRNLRSLHLGNNRFMGDLPPSLQNLTSLITMDLGNNFFTGSIPFWIGKSLPELRILNLQSNRFTGKIPRQLCRLSSLQLLNLANNNITGTIPPCFGNLSGMIENYSNEYVLVYRYNENILVNMKGNQWLFTKTIKFLISLDLSNNSIVGEIPDSLMNLVSLKNLNLSRNLLKGNIPMKIGNLQQVESLDLSMNMLSGRIPQSLATLHFISSLNLSFNKLFGPIPVGNQLQTLVDPSIYEGNNGLCGPPLLSCKPSNSLYSNDGKDEGQEDNDEGLFSYVTMGPGFVVGFMGFLASLHFIRSWRLAYFGFFENVYGWLTLSILLNLARLGRKFF